MTNCGTADAHKILWRLTKLAPGATIVRGGSPVTLDRLVQGRRVLVVEDGPTLTHGAMAYGAGFVAARDAGAHVVDPRDSAKGDIAALYAQYPHIGPVLPAVGYYPQQLAALAATIDAADIDLVVSGTPCDLAALIEIGKPVVRARYEYAELDTPGLGDLVDAFLDDR